MHNIFYAVMVVLVNSFVLFILLSITSAELFELKTNSCVIIGRRLVTVFQKDPYVAFWKIPYAEAPLLDLRFKPPVLTPLLVSNTFHNFSIPYIDSCHSYQNEDCLYLSIFMPEIPLNHIPIMVWLHEESYNHGPDFFIEEQVIVVIPSFRTGILGFLNTEDDFAGGNMGAKDIITALGWIRENISYFNGDINSVTVVGASLAANLVASLILSASSDDLFNKVIIHSGSALSPSEYTNLTNKTLQNLQWKLTSEYKKIDKDLIASLLLTSSLHELKYLSHNLFDSTEIRNRQRLIKSFGLSVENAERNYFMNMQPEEVYKNSLFDNEISIMFGFTNKELLNKLTKLAAHKYLLEFLNYNFHYLLPFNGKSDVFESTRYDNIKKKIKEFYFVNGTITSRSFKRYAKYMSDQIIYPILNQARKHARSSYKDVFLYRFSFNGTLNAGKIQAAIDTSIKGATSQDEICYLFRCKSFDETYRSGETIEKEFIKKIVRLWTNFAKFANPTPPENDPLLQWEPLANSGKLKVMDLGQTFKIINLPEQKRMKFWDELRKDYFT